MTSGSRLWAATSAILVQSVGPMALSVGCHRYTDAWMEFNLHHGPAKKGDENHKGPAREKVENPQDVSNGGCDAILGQRPSEGVEKSIVQFSRGFEVLLL